MANRASLLNTNVLTNDYSHLVELSEKHGVLYEEVAEAAYRIPLPWLCCFRQSDLRPYTVVYEDLEGAEVKEDYQLPCASLGTAVRNLKASLHLFEQIVGDATIAHEYWQDAVRALELLPLPFVTLYADEVIDGSYAEFAAALSGTEEAIPHLEVLCGYGYERTPFSLGEWSNLSPEEIRKDETRRNNAVALDCGFGFGAPLERAEAPEPYVPPKRVFLNRAQGVELTCNPSVVATLRFDSLVTRDFGFFCFVLDENNKPLPGGYAVFGNWPRSPDGGIEFLGASDRRQDIRIDFARLSSRARRLILALHRRQAQQDGLNFLQLKVKDDIEDVADFVVAGHEVAAVETLIVGEIRLDESRRLNTACQPYPQGVESILKHFGIEASTTYSGQTSPARRGKILRSGVNPVWLRSFPSTARQNRDWINRHDPDTVKDLEQYAQQGKCQQDLDRMRKPAGRQSVKHDSEFVPPYASWEGALRDGLRDYARHRLDEFEIRGVEQGAFDTALAARAFAAIYTRQMIDLHGHYLTPIRFYGRKWGWMDFDQVPFTALGVVIGCRDQAFRLARLQLAAWRRGYFSTRNSLPASHFLLRVLADYLGEPPHVSEGAGATDPAFDALFDRWRDPDSDVLMGPCLAACDLLTHSKSSGHWTHLPIALLLVVKLRSLMALPNPCLDHPLMCGALGTLPEPETAFDAIASRPDDLIERVRMRMKQDGYDEEAIFRECTTESTVQRLLHALDLGGTAPCDPAPVAVPTIRDLLSSNFGMILKVPDSWQLVDDGRSFRVTDRLTGMELNATGTEHNSSIPIKQWAQARLAQVELEMPRLAIFKPPYAMTCGSLIGIATEYRGTLPGRECESHVLILCLQADKQVLSVMIAASTEAFARNETLYRWLLQTQLSMGRYPEEKHELDRLRGHAERGDTACQYALAEKYLAGEDVTRDTSQALAWLRRAAERDHEPSVFFLGTLYLSGDEVAQDYRQALAWFDKGAKLESPRSNHVLGLMYYHGEHVERDYAKAFAYLETAASSGLGEAQFIVGSMCQNGQGTKQDLAQARRWYECAAQPTLLVPDGIADAQRELGFMCASGQGGQQDYEQALDWYKKSAAQGNTGAQYLLAGMYENGRGVPRDPAVAVEWLMKASARGHVEAQCNLGERYAKGKGVVQSDPLSFACFQRAAQQGHAAAQFRLGEMYHQGCGVTKDHEKAIQWYRMAAEQGHAEARALLGPRAWWKIW